MRPRSALNGKLYVVGGYVHDWAPTNAVYEYDPADDRWRERAPMPTPRGALAAAVIDGRIHAVGGVGGAGRIGRAATRARTKSTIRRPTNGRRARPCRPRAITWRWPRRGDGSTPSAAASTATMGATWRQTRAYDPATDRWQPGAPLPTARSGIAASVLGGRIVVVGGEAPAGTFNQVEAYDPTSDAWSAYARMPTARHGLGSAAVGGKMYVISGGPTPGASASAANEIFAP